MGFCLFMMAHSCETSLTVLVFFSFLALSSSTSSIFGSSSSSPSFFSSSSSSSSSISLSMVFSVQSEIG